MDQIRWKEKPIELRNLVDSSSLKKATLVQIGNRPAVVGRKINGQFILASPCKLSNEQFLSTEQAIILSSKYEGLWKVISIATPKTKNYIHRLTTTEIEQIYIQDIEKERPKPRSYICTKTIEAFDVIAHDNEDPTVADGQRIDRKMKHIEENVEFEVYDIGEVEYTPKEGERTSQDYIAAPKNKSRKLQFLRISGKDKELVIRNRVLRSLYCITKNESNPRQFLLEVNEQPSEIRPIASDGSMELTYLQSTQNLFKFLLNHESNTLLYARLVRGVFPIKAREFGDYMLFRRVLNGDQVPICYIQDFEVSLINPDLPVNVKLPIDANSWHSIPEIHAAELQCMQLSLALFSRHESEIYVKIDREKSLAPIVTKFDDNRRSSQPQRVVDIPEKDTDTLETLSDNLLSNLKIQSTTNLEHPKSRKSPTLPDKTIPQQSAIKMSPTKNNFHPVSEMLYRDHEKRIQYTDVIIVQQPQQQQQQQQQQQHHQHHQHQQLQRQHSRPHESSHPTQRRIFGTISKISSSK